MSRVNVLVAIPEFETIITGTPVHPIPADVLDYMPADVVRDENGAEISRTPATGFKQVNKLMGWSDREV